MVKASVVVPFFNKIGMTSSCVRALERARSFNVTPFEIVLVDDCSTEDTSDLKGTSARLIRNQSNQGYLRSTNRGAAHATGDYLLLLNNDTEPIGSFLDALIDLLERRPDAAMVGSRLVYPDGRLQEAGAIVFNDASGWNFGRGGDPFHPFFAFERPVRYCSAASLLVRRSFWDEVGGFDARFAPAYYEDTDLAMEAWSRGRQVWYQPASTVIHYEGASHGADESSGLKRYQEINRQLFVDKWQSDLQKFPAPGARNAFANRSVRPRGQIVVVDNEVPTPDRDSGSLRITRIMELMLDSGFSVTYCAHNNRLRSEGMDQFARAGIEVWGDPGTWVDHLTAMSTEIRLVWIARPHVMSAWSGFFRTLLPGVPVVFDTVDLHSVRQARERAVLGDEAVSAESRVDEDVELALARDADLTVVVSDEERKFLFDRGIRDVCVVPNVHRATGVSARWSGRETEALFVGGFRHAPNVDGVDWFVRSVLPKIRESLPAFRLRVVGADITDEMRRRIEAEGVLVDGYLPSLEAAYRRTGVVIAPLRFGAGVKGKVGEAMSHGVPLVLTSVAAEGFVGFRSGIVADDADDFAAAIVHLLSDDDAWAAYSRNGIEDIARQMSPESVGRQLERLFRAVVSE